MTTTLSEAMAAQHGSAYHFGYTDKEALEYLFENLERLGRNDVEAVTIRPHPSERVEKYDWARRRYGEIIQYGGARTLPEELTRHDLVVGGESMALVIALFSGKRVMCCIPPGGKPSSLPYKEIENLQDLARSRGEYSQTPRTDS